MKKEIRTLNDKGTEIQITIADERWYLREAENGEVTAYPSVTWITEHYPKGVAFYKWLANKGWDEAEAIKSAAGDVGHKVHQIATTLLKGKKVAIDDAVLNSETGEPEPIALEEYEAALSFVEWFRAVKPEIVANEMVVFDDEHFYAGTADFICKLKEEIKIDSRTKMPAGTWLIDFKTGQNIWPSYGLQLSAYKAALKKHGIAVDNMAILQLGYRRNKHGYKISIMPDQFDLFLATKQIWQNEAKNTQVFKADYPTELSLGIPASKALKGGETHD